MRVQCADKNRITQDCDSAVMHWSIFYGRVHRIGKRPQLLSCSRIERPQIAGRQGYKHRMARDDGGTFRAAHEFWKLEDPFQPQLANILSPDLRETAMPLAVIC